MFEIYTLDNGLRVVTEYIEHVNSVKVCQWNFTLYRAYVF